MSSLQTNQCEIPYIEVTAYKACRVRIPQACAITAYRASRPLLTRNRQNPGPTYPVAIRADPTTPAHAPAHSNTRLPEAFASHDAQGVFGVVGEGGRAAMLAATQPAVILRLFSHFIFECVLILNNQHREVAIYQRNDGPFFGRDIHALITNPPVAHFMKLIWHPERGR